MYNMDFEATNGHLLGRKMFNGRDSRQREARRIVRLIPKPEKRMNMSGNGYREPEGGTNYPLSNDKMIFGMRPKTLAVALGIIVISIWVISKTGKDNVAPQMASGGMV